MAILVRAFPGQIHKRGQFASYLAWSSLNAVFLVIRIEAKTWHFFRKKKIAWRYVAIARVDRLHIMCYDHKLKGGDSVGPESSFT